MCKDIFYEVADIIEVNKWERTKINVTTSDGQITTIEIFHDGNKNHSHLINCRNLGKFLSAFKGNTFRNKRKDGGDMYILGNGTRMNEQSTVTYGLTNSVGVDKLLHNISNTSLEYYTSIGFEKEVKEIVKQKKIKNHEFMENCFVNSIVSSCNLINSAHLDVNDATDSIVTWTDDNIVDTENWYFLLPNVTRDGKKAIIIKIQDGMTIKWDATVLFHCSTNKRLNSNYNVYGTYFGCRKH